MPDYCQRPGKRSAAARSEQPHRPSAGDVSLGSMVRFW